MISKTTRAHGARLAGVLALSSDGASLGGSLTEVGMLKLLALGLFLAGSASLRAPAPCASDALVEAHALRAVDDPPPDPTECPFCGGNPELHRARIQGLEALCARMAMLVTRIP